MVGFIILSVVLSFLFIGLILFLLIYGFIKKKKSFWISGLALALASILLYFFLYHNRYNEAVSKTTESTY